MPDSKFCYHCYLVFSNFKPEGAVDQTDHWATLSIRCFGSGDAEMGWNLCIHYWGLGE